MQRQMQIYLGGMTQETPDQPVGYDQLKARAEAEMTPEAYGYIAGGAGSEDTMRANREAFRRWRVVPRFLRDVERRDLRVTLFGQTLRAPVLLAPIGVLSIAHPEAEKAVARAAADLDVPMILSTVSSFSIEDVAGASGDGKRWFQLYWPKDFDLAASLVHRAENAGYSALVVTLDTYLLAWRDRDIDNAYLPFLYGEGLANYYSDPAFCRHLDEPPEENPTQAVLTFARLFSNAGLTWEDLDWLREQTDLPIILKGILHPDDARKALGKGVDGLIVSNHGGRQMDGGLAALDALPPIVEAVGEQTTLLFDSGIRRGADVFKALALGAEAVLLGRPYALGLGLRGADGVRDVVHNLLAEIDLTLGLAGCASWAEVGPGNLRHLEPPAAGPSAERSA
jgi:isopentenyl diphosphate isomerase/L-lactate dehydrogenase-like FMN-dependent dehydrogenase